MTRKYCDICGKEIVADSLFGLLVRFVKTPFFDKKTQVMEMKVKEEHLELCEKCTEQISQKLSEMSKKVKKVK